MGTASLDSEEHDMTGPVRRVHYFLGQLLTAEDLQAEQDYHREMRYLHNRLLGHGVVHGLEVAVGDDGGLVVRPGLAIDPGGRELVLSSEVAVDLSAGTAADGPQDLTAVWDQQPDAFVPAADDCGDEVRFTRWLEQPRLALGPPGQAGVDGVVLARVHVHGGRAVRVDRHGRSTWRPRPTAADEAEAVAAGAPRPGGAE